MSIILSGLLNLIFPLLATDSATYVIIARVLMGVATGSTFPGMHAMLARWAPPEERTRIASIVYAGKATCNSVLLLPVNYDCRIILLISLPQAAKQGRLSRTLSLV